MRNNLRTIVDLNDETDTKLWLEELNALLSPEDFREVGAAGQPGFTNSWANRTGEAVAGFYKAYGRVWLKGGMDAGTNATSAFQLPVGYRPDKKLQFPFVHISTPTISGLITINIAGEVIPDTGTGGGVTLSGISFRV